jgi:hypothetical protein
MSADEHICTVVSQQHRGWWDHALSAVPKAKVIVQPRNCGTANGILLPLLYIMARDPGARIVLLPSDHHVRDEQVLAAALQRAVQELLRGATRFYSLEFIRRQKIRTSAILCPAPETEQSRRSIDLSKNRTYRLLAIWSKPAHCGTPSLWPPELEHSYRYSFSASHKSSSVCRP